MAVIIDGKAISAQIKEEVKQEVADLQAAGKQVALAVIQVGSDTASSVYVRNKQKACEYVGIQSFGYVLDETVTEEELLEMIGQLNENDEINGILIQLPLPKHINTDRIISAVSPEKDVDGFHPQNVGELFVGQDGLQPCTPAGIIQLLKRSNISIEGKECVVLGRSNIVGKPAAMLLLAENGTVTVAHSKTKNLRELTSRADILIAAVGQPEFITREYIKEGAVVIDVGIHRDKDNKLCGDVDFTDVIDKVSAITPVPGGVGPMTVAMLMHNCVEAAKN